MISKRVLIKISGEALKGDQESIHDFKVLDYISSNVAKLIENDYSVSIVVGGGNIYRGASLKEMEISRVQGDHIGMLSTIINGIVIYENMKKHKIDCRLMSSIWVDQICDKYSYDKALKHLSNNRVMIFVGGTGNPFYTTDSSAVLKAIEMKCKIVLKATNIDGVYSEDPKKNPDAKRFDKINYDQVIINNLKIMDLGAISMAKEFKLPIKIFKLGDDFYDILSGMGKYTLISEE